MHTQTADAFLMVRPAHFGFDPATAATNAFQIPAADASRAHLQAIEEFDAFVATLRAHNITVIVAEDTPQPLKPDAIFPNNWLSTWPDGRVFLYPMCAPSRRLERREDILKLLAQEYYIEKILDRTTPEDQDTFLESTGAIVFDHLNLTAYACRSSRCDETLFTRHCQELGYKPILFTATDETGLPIYHTNVMMGIGRSTAVVCLEAIPNATERQIVGESLAKTHAITTISLEQMRHFAGNVLEVENAKGEHFLILSQRAHDALRPEQRKALSQDKQLLVISIPTIEKVGGGGVRCMMAEIFLPRLRREQKS